VEVVYELSEDGKGYYIYERVSGRNVRPPSYISREDLQRYRDNVATRNQLKEFSRNAGSAAGATQLDPFAPSLRVNSKLFESIFGSSKIDIKYNVSVLLDFAIRVNEMKNPNLPQRQQRNTAFNFNQQIQLNVVGSIGEKLKLNTNFDTESTFNFENQFKTAYAGTEDDIIQSVEAGNVSMPLNNSLITGGTNLFGIKLATKFGPVLVTSIASQQRGQSNEVLVKGGTQQTPYTKKAAEYDENRHFFLNHFFRSIYENSLRNLPLITSPINVNRVEVWVTNRQSSQLINNRNAVGFVDLGENDTLFKGRFYDLKYLRPGTRFPANEANLLYEQLRTNEGQYRNYASAQAALTNNLGMRVGDHYEILQNMRLLRPDEFTLHPQLGYITLNSRLMPNDVLFVAFEYTIAGQTEPFRVGEFSTDVPSDANNLRVLFLKMLKPSAIRPGISPSNPQGPGYPTWDLMMKNIYSMGGFNLSPDGFTCDILYESIDGNGDLNYLPTPEFNNRPLIQVFALDQLINNSERGSDNRFDFVPNVTVIPDKGLVRFPVLEPFGQHLIRQFKQNPQEDAATYGFDQLYRYTQADAMQFFPTQNRFKFRGMSSSRSTGSEIYLNAVQVTQGSVRVTAGGSQLVEGSDYSVDYQVGKVTILNPAVLSSGQDIRVTFETNALFAIQQKTLVGSRIDYKPFKNLAVGATIMHLNERPLINKVQIGEEPINNTIWGLDGSFKRESKFLTKLVDKLPFYSTKVASEITAQGEFAQILPGHPSQISPNPADNGVAYIDDFEGSRNVIDLSGNQAWKIASRPLGIPLPPGANPLRDNYTRAHMSWYFIDPQIFQSPSQYNLSTDSPDLNAHYSRRVFFREVFPQKFVIPGTIFNTFDIQYFPQERGSYNFQADSRKVGANGLFTNPRENWAGITRRTTGNTDFEAGNFEFIEFWVMDPYLDNPNHEGGDLYLNLGKVSEDVLPDNVRSVENNLPSTREQYLSGANMTTTPWSRQLITNPPPQPAFNNDRNARPFQDVGLDGVGAAENAEAVFFADYLNQIRAVVTEPSALERIEQDPSSDNFVFFRDNRVNNAPLLQRYKYMANTEGNSPVVDESSAITNQGTQFPDDEDINADQQASTINAYFEYKISMKRQDLQLGQNYIVDIRETDYEDSRKQKIPTRWYQFRVPLRSGTPVGAITDFKAIDFIRLYLTNFAEPVVLRFATLELVSTPWRPFRDYLGREGETIDPDPGNNNLGNFTIGTVNIEANSTKKPFPYKVPPDIERQRIPTAATAQQNLFMNEQALLLNACNLREGDARAAFKIINYDLRNYDRLRMWVHGESVDGPVPGSGNFRNCGDITMFVRIGSDMTENYYEYEVPVCPSSLNDTTPRGIWLNDIDLAIPLLAEAKNERNRAVENGLASFTKPYKAVTLAGLAQGQAIYVTGNPQLNNCKNILIGMRNPANNGGPICAEIWVNEIRVTGFNERASIAANGTVRVKLADLADVTLSASKTSIGFGGIDKKVNDRSFVDDSRYSLAVNLNAGKLLPEKAGIQLPVYFTYGERFITPRFDPLAQDINYETVLRQKENPQDYREASVDYERNYSYSFTNVKKIRLNTKRKPKVWDVENWAFTYGYTNRFKSNAIIEYWQTERFNGAVAWAHNFTPKFVKPLKFLGKKENIITSFNFSPLPRALAFRIEGNRIYDERRDRSVSNALPAPTIYNQDFQVTRTYNLQWDLAQSLKLTYNATNVSRVDEPRGRIDSPERRDSLLGNLLTLGREQGVPYKDNLINMGRTLSFNQTINTTYSLPINKIKLLNWVNASVTYNADFGWRTAALQNTDLGNTINNGQTMQGNATLSFSQFYKKFKWIDKALKPIPPKNLVSKADSTRYDGDGWVVFGKKTGQTLLRWVVSPQNLNLTYSRNGTTVLPGYRPRTDNFGFDFNYLSPDGRSSMAPGWDVVLGMQPDLTPNGWFAKARENGWITNSPEMNLPFATTRSEQITVRALLEPFKDFKVDINFDRQQQEQRSGLYAFDATTGEYVLSNPSITGNFSMSFLAIGTSFDGVDTVSKVFQTFAQNRRIISERLAQANPFYGELVERGLITGGRAGQVGYYNGYTGSSQDVLIPAFLSSYGPYKPGTIPLSAFPQIPLPNWQVNYNGLANLEGLKDIFKTITIKHAYRSTYTASYLLNLKALDAEGGFSRNTNTVDTGFVDGSSIATPLVDYQPGQTIQTVTISEQFQPLIGFNATMKNGIGINFDFKKSRTLMFNVGQLQLNENHNTEVTFGANWRRDAKGQPLTIFGRELPLKNSLTVRFEMTLRNSRTQNRRLDSTNPPDATGGNFNLIFKPSIDYQVNTQLTARLYYEYNRNEPVLSNSFPTIFQAFGVQVRLTL
jgi:cell surface protein SprA